MGTFKGDREVVLIVEDLISQSTLQCRICHEEELGCSNGLEAPCACSGSVKFAHRDCIQRWCNEKGNTICEICLQNFEPGYTAPTPPKKTQADDVAVTIRGSLEVPRQIHELHNPGLMAIVAIDDSDSIETDYSECSSAAERSANCFRSIAIMFTIFLLVRHLLSILTSEADQYAFTLVTLFLLRACGVLLPLYIIVRVVSGIQNSLQRLYIESDEDSSFGEDDDEEDEMLIHPTVQIQS
ncbi:hypothetical protein Syun_028711 [Stephania yunnanensis]|uniref:RING-CH-type domain-containing protein n=1 Tax=Stephania yunnanensis TaxID=152371 RepID=A0AAP0E7M3_9MAGN